MDTISIETGQHRGFINITQEVKDCVRKSGVKDGICLVYSPHTTCGIALNESADPDVRRDLLFALNRMAPNEGFHHFEGNSDAHVQAALMGFSQSFIISGRQLLLGRWQAIYLAEFDGPRLRTVQVQCLSQE